MITVEINTDHIRLSQFLKLADAVSSGVTAKEHILADEVMVNGVVENRRGRKLRPGDRVEFVGHSYLVVSG